MTDIARITEIIEPEAKALGFELVRVKLFGADEERTLQIMAERPDTRQLVIEDCAELSRRVSDRFDALEEQGEVLIDEAYRLEVSSPGIDRPLTRAKDWTDWADHETRVVLVEAVPAGEGTRRSLQGDIVGIAGDTVEFYDRKSGEVRFTLDNVSSAKLVLTDKLIAATRPIDTAGADEIEDEDILEEQED